MNLNFRCQLGRVICAISLLTVPLDLAMAQTAEEEFKALRQEFSIDRQEYATVNLQLTEAESSAFWPLYHTYRAEMDKIGDGLVTLVLEYARQYPNLPEARAKTMLKEHSELEVKYAATRSAHFKKIAKVLPASKALRFAQLETKLDLAARHQLGAKIPLVPIEGKILGQVTAAGVYAEGQAGGVVVQTLEITARVAAIDPASRKVTLVSEDGIKQTVKVGPEAINFDQIQVGDRLKIIATEELVVQIGEPGESAAIAASTVVALAPKGAKPAAVAAETRQVTGTITAIDATKRTATLRFEDGTSRTLPVRKDIDVSKRKVGEQVVFRVTEMIAISVTKA